MSKNKSKGKVEKQKNKKSKAVDGNSKLLTQKGGSELLEPIMAVEVATPEDYMGDVMGDLNRNR